MYVYIVIFYSRIFWGKNLVYVNKIKLLLTSYSVSDIGVLYVAVNKIDNGCNLLEYTFQFGDTSKQENVSRNE